MKPKFNFTLTGFLIALIVISMISVGFSLIIGELQTNYNTSINHSFGKYNVTDEITEDVNEIRNKTDIGGDAGVLDIIGSYFRSGYAALKVSGKSIDMMDDVIDDAVEDVEPLGYFRTSIITMILIGLFVGIFLTVLVKWKL